MMTSTANLTFLMADAAIKATVLLGLAAIVAAFLRHASAAAKHLVWTLGLIGALSLPFLTRTLPSLDLALPHVSRAQARLLPSLPTAVAAPEKASMRAGAAEASEMATKATATVSAEVLPPLAWPVFMTLAWLFGVRPDTDATDFRAGGGAKDRAGKRSPRGASRRLSGGGLPDTCASQTDQFPPGLRAGRCFGADGLGLPPTDGCSACRGRRLAAGTGTRRAAA